MHTPDCQCISRLNEPPVLRSGCVAGRLLPTASTTKPCWSETLPQFPYLTPHHLCVSSIQYVICASCTVRQVIHATQSTSWYDLTQYTNHSHLNAKLSEFVLLQLPRLLILQQVPTWPQEQKLFISLGPTVGWIWMPGWETHGFFVLFSFFWPEQGAELWAELLFSTFAHKFGVATRK